jgi:hypothetical protein
MDRDLVGPTERRRRPWARWCASSFEGAPPETRLTLAHRPRLHSQVLASCIRPNLRPQALLAPRLHSEGKMAAAGLTAQAPFGLMAMSMDVENCPPPFMGAGKVRGRSMVQGGGVVAAASLCPAPLTPDGPLPHRRTPSRCSLTPWALVRAATRCASAAGPGTGSKSEFARTRPEPPVPPFPPGCLHVVGADRAAVSEAVRRRQR